MKSSSSSWEKHTTGTKQGREKSRAPGTHLNWLSPQAGVETNPPTGLEVRALYVAAQLLRRGAARVAKPPGGEVRC